MLGASACEYFVVNVDEAVPFRMWRNGDARVDVCVIGRACVSVA